MKSKSSGNTDDSKRGRGLGPEGQPTKGGRLSGSQKEIKPGDYDGHKIGTRHK